MNKLPDGRLLFPHKGKPPSLMEGYERDPGDPYILIPVFIPCQHRKINRTVCQSGKIRTNWFCTKLGIIVNPPTCEACEVEDKLPGG